MFEICTAEEFVIIVVQNIDIEQYSLHLDNRLSRLFLVEQRITNNELTSSLSKGASQLLDSYKESKLRQLFKPSCFVYFIFSLQMLLLML